jgi:hypothetical protein
LAVGRTRAAAFFDWVAVWGGRKFGGDDRMQKEEFSQKPRANSQERLHRHHPLPQYVLRVYEIKQAIAVSAGTVMCDEGKSEVVGVQQLRN